MDLQQDIGSLVGFFMQVRVTPQLEMLRGNPLLVMDDSYAEQARHSSLTTTPDLP